MDKKLKLEIFLKKGQLRRLIWEKLNKPKTASEISKEINKHRSAISRTLLDFEKEGFVKCINPEDSSFRHYVRK